MIKWGIKTPFTLINARFEEISEKPFFRRYINKRVVVIISGFFEWDK